MINRNNTSEVHGSIILGVKLQIRALGKTLNWKDVSFPARPDWIWVWQKAGKSQVIVCIMLSKKSDGDVRVCYYLHSS